MLKKIKFAGLLALTLSLGQVSFVEARAEEHFNVDGYTLEYGKCLDRSEGVTMSMLECMDKELQLQDKLLNKTYKEVMAVLSPEQKELLKAGQRAWLKMRDADAELQGTLTGGTIDKLNFHSTHLDYTVRRIAYLQSLLEVL